MQDDDKDDDDISEHTHNVHAPGAAGDVVVMADVIREPHEVAMVDEAAPGHECKPCITSQCI